MSELSTSAASISTQQLQASWKLVEASLARTPLELLCEAADMDVSQMSKVRSGQLGAKVREVVRMLGAAGIKCVPADRVCVDRAKYEAMVTIASAAMSCPETVRKLTWDE